MKQLFVLIFWLFCLTGLAQQIPAAPQPPRLVNDFAHILEPDQEQHLEQMLVAFDDSTSIQIAVVTVTTLQDYEPVDYAVKLGREWGVGNKKTNNGVILLISTEEGRRKIFIAPGYGMEGAIPDITARQIVVNEMVPSFKEGNYYRGILNGVQGIMQASRGEYTAPEGYSDRGNRSESGGLIFFIIVVGIILFIIFANRGGGSGGGMISRRGYRNFNGPVIFMPNSGGDWGGGGGWSGGDSGGGFGGYGGGSFGGGGAGGDW